jgi:hypothetical protein
MAVLNQVEKKIKMNQWDIVRFQILVHCYLKQINISRHELSCLTLLGIVGEQVIEDFCNVATGNKIFSSNQSVRNSISKASKLGLITKTGTNRKRIHLDYSMNIQASGNILLDYKIVHLETIKEPQLESQES